MRICAYSLHSFSDYLDRMGDTNVHDDASEASLLPNQVPNLAAALEQSHSDVEAEKSVLARTLHDDLGGLLLAALMDVGWSLSRPVLPEDVKDKLSRAEGLLKAAIDLKRELIESLRPTLLDNVGLFSTLRWHMKARCEARAVPYKLRLPNAEEDFSPEVRIGVFRIVQEALKDVLSTYAGGDLALTVEMIGGVLHCHLIHQCTGMDGRMSEERSSPATSMHHRAGRVNGTVRWRKSRAGSHMHLEVPIPH